MKRDRERERESRSAANILYVELKLKIFKDLKSFPFPRKQSRDFEKKGIFLVLVKFLFEREDVLRTGGSKVSLGYSLLHPIQL